MRKPFEFKKFIIHQESVSLPVNTDSVLFGALANFNKPANIYDMGTGTGLLIFMMSQKHPDSNIIGFENDIDSLACVQQNISLNPKFSNLKVKLFNWWDMQLDKPAQAIICNPPFFFNQLSSTDTKRSISRHLKEYDLIFLIERMSKWLAQEGEIAFLLPFKQDVYAEYEKALNKSQVHIEQAVKIKAHAEKDFHLWYIFGKKSSRNSGKNPIQDLVVYEKPGGPFTVESKRLLSPFLQDRALGI
ncbi:MAG: methyltransferase [Bacteroidota bacterium]|nr:methyltransferase [Bacteroidota bacterium]